MSASQFQSLRGLNLSEGEKIRTHEGVTSVNHKHIRVVLCGIENECTVIKKEMGEDENLI